MDLVVSPTIVGFNTQSNGHGPQVLAPGQLIDALVLQLLDATTVRLSVAGTILDVKTRVPLEPGSAVRLAVRGYGNETRFVIVGQGSGLQDDGSAEGVVQNGGPPATAQESAPQSPATQVDVSIRGEGIEEGGATVRAPASSPSASSSAPVVQDTDPTIALANAMRGAAARQTGLAPVFAQAAAALDAPDVPPAVRLAAAQLLALRAPFDQGVSAAAVQKAISSAGLFLEARLAALTRGQAMSAVTANGSPDASVIGASTVSAGEIKADIKAMLFTLREALKGWLDSAQGVTANAGSIGRPMSPAGSAVSAQADEMTALAMALVAEADVSPPPPYRNAPTQGQQPAAAAVRSDAPALLIGHVLLEETNGALARTVLLQTASLPVTPGAAAEHADTRGTHWNLEVPFMTPQGAAIAQFEISRDDHKAAAAERRLPGWRVNFSVDVEPMGPVHAQVSLSGPRAAVRLWAERSPTATALRDSTSELGDALRQAALEPVEIMVRDGAPPRPLKPGAGRFVDRAS